MLHIVTDLSASRIRWVMFIFRFKQLSIVRLVFFEANGVRCRGVEFSIGRSFLHLVDSDYLLVRWRVFFSLGKVWWRAD